MKTILLYSLLVGLPTLGLLAIVCFCHSSEVPLGTVRHLSVVTQIGLPSDSFLHLAQLMVILLLARSVGALFRLIHQPRVVGEMVAGILLGPSILGWLVPQASAFLFPAGSLGSLKTLSEIGLLLYMFIVGLRLDRGSLSVHRHVFLLTSHTSIVFPFTLGALLALYLYRSLAGQGATFAQFALSSALQ
jgi:Kef-type K+ transport system membrane component KefB